MRMTVDEAARLKDRFEEYIDSLVGEDYTVAQGADYFRIEILRKRQRVQHPVNDTGYIDIRPFTSRKDI